MKGYDIVNIAIGKHDPKLERSTPPTWKEIMEGWYNNQDKENHVLDKDKNGNIYWKNFKAYNTTKEQSKTE